MHTCPPRCPHQVDTCSLCHFFPLYTLKQYSIPQALALPQSLVPQGTGSFGMYSFTDVRPVKLIIISSTELNSPGSMVLKLLSLLESMAVFSRLCLSSVLLSLPNVWWSEDFWRWLQSGCGSCHQQFCSTLTLTPSSTLLTVHPSAQCGLTCLLLAPVFPYWRWSKLSFLVAVRVRLFGNNFHHLSRNELTKVH